MDLEDSSRMEYEIVVPVKPLPSSDKPLKGLLKRNKCDSNSSTSSSSSSTSSEDGKSKKRVKFAETMMVFCDDWPEEVMPQIIALKSPTDFNLIEIVASGFMFDPPVEYQDLLPFDPPPDYQDCVSSNKHPSIIPMSSYERDSSISFIDDDDQCESNEFANDYHNQLNSSLHWENILNENEILEEDIIGVLKEDEILQAIGSQTADIDTVFHPMESEENFNEADFPVHYQNGQYIHNQGYTQNDGSNSHLISGEGHHIVDGYCDRVNQATETSETFSEAEELSSDLASDSSFTSQDTIILTTPLASDPNSLCRADFHPSTSSSVDSILSPGKTVVTYVDQYSTEYTKIDVNLEYEPKPNKPVLETINDDEEEVRSDADIGSISEDRSSLNESVLEDVNKVNGDNYRSKGSHETSVKDDCTASIEGDDGDDDIVSEADNSLNQGEGSSNNIDEVDGVIRREDKDNNLSKEDGSSQSTENNESYTGDINGAIRNDSNGSKILNTTNEPVNQLNESSESMNKRPLVTRTTGLVKEGPEGSVKSVSLAKPLTAPSSLTSSSASSNSSSTMTSSSSSTSAPIQSSVIVPTAMVPSATFIPTQSASVVNTNVVVIGLVDCEGINKSTHHPQQLLTTVPMNATSVSVSAIRKAFEVKHESEVPLYENTTELRAKTKNTSQSAPARPKSFPFSNFKLGKSVESNKNSCSNTVNSTTTNSSSTTSINNNINNQTSSSNITGTSSGSSLIKEATNVMTEKLKWLTLHGGDSSKQSSSNDESGKTTQQLSTTTPPPPPSSSSSSSSTTTTIINDNKTKQPQQQQAQRSKEDLIIEYTSEPRGAQQVKRVSLTEAALKAATCNATKGVITLQGTPLSAQIVNHYHHLHHHGQTIPSSHQIVHPSHQHPHQQQPIQQPITIPVSHLQCFPAGTTIPASISNMGTSHQIVHAHPNLSNQHHGPTPQQIQQVKSLASAVPSSTSSQFIIPSVSPAPQQQQQQQPQPQTQQQQQQPHAQQYHIYPVTKCRAASPQFINQYYTTTTPSGQRQLVYVSHVAPGQQYMTSQIHHHHHHPHAHLHPQQQQTQQSQSQTSGQTIHGQPTQIQAGTVTMVSGATQGSRETPSPSIIQLHCRPASAMSNQQIVGSRIYAQPLQHGFVAVPKDSSFPNPSEIRRRDGLNAYPIVKEDPLKVVNTSSNGSTNSGNSPTASSLSSSLSSASSSSSSSASPSASSTTSTVPNNTNNKCGSSDSANLTLSDTKDELEQFVENDIQRIERIKRRYSLTEEGDDPTFGFGRRPSVRGIKPKYGPNEIIRHMQMQLRPSIQSVAPQTLPKQAKVINTQIVNESLNLVSSASSHGLTTSLSTTTITTATPVILTSGSIASQTSSSSSSSAPPQVPRTAQIHLITRHSHSHCHPHLISASQVGSVPNLRQHLVSSTASISPSSSSSSPSPSGHNTIGHRHVYLIPHVQGGPQYQRIVQAAGATLPRHHPGQHQQGQSQHQSSTGLTQQLSAQQAAMLMMKGMGGRVKIINGSQSAGSIGIVGNQPPLSRPSSSLGHPIQRLSGDTELRSTPQSSTSSSSDVTCKQCPARAPGLLEPQPGQPQSITIIGNKVGPCLLQHKTISMPNVSLIKSLPQTLTVVPINDIKDERGTPEGASSSPTHSSEPVFVESNNKTKPLDIVNADTMSTGSTSSCSSSTSSGNTGTSSSNNIVITNNTKNNNDLNNCISNNSNNANNNNNDNDDITVKHNNNNNNTNNLTNSNNNINTNNNINNNLNNNPDLVKDATTSALKAKKNISTNLKDGKTKPVSSKDGVIYYSMNV